MARYIKKNKKYNRFKYPYNYNGFILINKFNSKVVLKEKLLSLMNIFTFLYTCKYYYQHLNWFKKYYYDNIFLVLKKYFKSIKILKRMYNIIYYNLKNTNINKNNIRIYKSYITFINRIYYFYFKPVLLKYYTFFNYGIKNKINLINNYIIKKDIYVFFNYIIYRFILFLIVYWSNFFLRNLIIKFHNKYNIIFFSKLLFKSLFKFRFIRHFKLEKFYILYKILNYTVLI